MSRMFSGSSSKRRKQASSLDSDYEPSQSETAASSHFAPGDDEVMDESNPDHLFDPSRYDGPRKAWNATEYTRARGNMAYL